MNQVLFACARVCVNRIFVFLFLVYFIDFAQGEYQ